jgi:hypothetical protein
MIFNWEHVEHLSELDSSYAAGFSVSLDVCRAAFEDDKNRLDALMPLIADSIESREQVEWGRDMAIVFEQWRDGIPPFMPSLLSVACDYFDIIDHSPLLDVALSACILSEIPHFNPYHNNHHFREVMTMVICFCAHHNRIYQDKTLSSDDILTVITAAAVHDFAHDGQGNVTDGHHIISRLEQKAYDETAPFLKAAGADDELCDLIHALILGTDVSKGTEGKSPSEILRDIYKAHIGKGEMPFIHDSMVILTKDMKFALMGLILNEADIAPSTGLSYDYAIKMTVLVAKESSVLQPSATTLNGFMKHICHGQYLSGVARHLMAENFTAISLQAEQDSEDNRLYA